MAKYNSKNPEDQPIHDMMDDIEVAYQKAEKNGAHPLKILMAIGYMEHLYKEEKNFTKEDISIVNLVNVLGGHLNKEI